ncbi:MULTISPECIES: hypothetical protein [Serratia]|uniref:Uncharacterized protein n=1 Tax=Serratia quinivorans TaxID=137545 RepID=A0A379YB19_9GAMM|nr:MULTISPECIES: hypothetical protein [Serratia]CAI1697673.1 Uncharacterised protein [Serratia quinivorans]SUI43106.1 Uncharacterised protein [Serratia quinivorans]
MSVINRQAGKVSFNGVGGTVYNGLVHVASKIHYTYMGYGLITVDITNNYGESYFLVYSSSDGNTAAMSAALSAAVNALLNGSSYVTVIEDADNPGSILGTDIRSS